MLASLARPSVTASVSWNNVDPRWYADLATSIRSDAGIVATPERALGVAVVFRAISVRAHAVASIPLVIYKRLKDDGKERATEHPLYRTLHDQPNAWMTSFRWRHLAMVQKILYGNHYSELVPSSRGLQLAPLPPTTTRVVDQLPDGRLLYVTRPMSRTGLSGFGPERRIVQDDILHLRGFSMDGHMGLSLPQVAKNALGLALAAERHGSMFLRKGARFAGVFSTEGRMDEDTRKENEAALARAYGGSDASGMSPLLTGGLSFSPTSADNRASQWLELRDFQVQDTLRFIGVPGVLCGYADKTSTYASAEQFFLSFVTHTVRPDTEDFAQELNASVVTGGPEFFAEFILEGLLKGDIRTRYSSHQLAIHSGWKTRNEVRIEESYNRGPDELDQFVMPAGSSGVVDEGADDVARDQERAADQRRQDAEREQQARQRREAESRAVQADARWQALATRAAERLVRKEVNAIAGAGRQQGAAKRFAGDPEGWAVWLAKFYGDHAATIAADLGVPDAAATAYSTAQVARLEAGLGTGFPDEFAATSTMSLLALLNPSEIEP